MEEEYEDLTNSELRCFGKEAIVIYYDYDIGITIVSKHDKDNYILCGLGRLAPNRITPYDDARWRKQFEYISQKIKEEKLEFSDLALTLDLTPTSEGPTSETCPFNQ